MQVPDIEEFQLPQPSEEDKVQTGKDFLERARVIFKGTRMEQALLKLHQAKDCQTETQTGQPVEETVPQIPESALKGTTS